MKILVIQQKMIGDVLTSSILFEVLRENFPNAELHYLINAHTKPVVDNNPCIDRIILFTPKIEKNKNKLLTFLKDIRKEQYDVVVDIYAKILSAIITRFSKAKIRIGYKKSYSKFIYTHTFKHKRLRSKSVGLAYENRLMLLQPLIKNINYKVAPKIHINTSEKTKLLKKFHKSSLMVDTEDYIMINILGSSLIKTYPLENMAILLDNIVKNHPKIKLLLNYIPKQKLDVDKLLSSCKPNTHKNISSYYASDLREFIVLASFCKMVIGNEGGAINMGKALLIPTFAIFSPWIRKETWGTPENDKLNKTVHLKDYKPELFNNYSQKAFKEKALDLYQKFKPELIIRELNLFIKKHL